MMSAKMAILGILKIYHVKICVCDVTNKILSSDSNYIANVVM